MRSLIFSLILLLSIFNSCKKELSCEGCIGNSANKPPTAIAGPDQLITLPTDSVLLDGTASSDPDGIISSYLWTKISGPASFTIVNPNDSISKIETFVAGIYQFELQVTDNNGLSARDTTQVVVKDAISNNISPIAIAGNDTTIKTNQTSCAPLSITLKLNGNTSCDPDGTISSYFWTGPNGIVNPNSATTTITGVFYGTISVTLKVTDNKGAVAYDTIHISILPANRPLIPARLVPIATLSIARGEITMAAAGNKILFAGGAENPGGCALSRVDIYDVTSNLWTTSELSEARIGMGTASLGNKIFFGGGFRPQLFPNTTTCFIGNGWYPETRSSAVDIYDASTNTWSLSRLSTRRTPQGASAGNKVIFAGGDEWNSVAIPSNVTDTYDANTNMWTSGNLMEGKGLPQIATLDNKMFLAGGAAQLDGDYFFGITKRIDVFDAVLNKWSVDFLSAERASMASIGINNKIYLAGGVVANSDPDILYVATSLVEIRDLATNTTSFDCLSEPRDQLTAIRKDNKIIFFGKYNVTRFDVYDLATNSWSIGVLPQKFHSASVISHKNIIYVVGSLASGASSSQVWTLEF